jgi:flagellar biosynthesis protein FlhB
VGRLRNGLAYLSTSTRQWLSNIWAVLAAASPEDVIPPWLWTRFWNTFNWIKLQFPRAAGWRSTPYEQMTASIVLAVAMILVSIGTLTWFAPIMIFPFILGAARLHPTIDRLWPLADEKGPI